MTLALCFSCGHVKFGAIVPCGECGVPSTGDMQLDIAFSDHYMAHSTLEQFGQIVKLIHSVETNPQVCFWTFIQYVSLNHSNLLTADTPAEIAEQVQRLYDRLDFPPVEVLPGMRNATDEDAQPDKPPPQGATNRKEGSLPDKKWWQFWR